jgi:cytochrome bd-type quinol oxidase subunit 2
MLFWDTRCLRRIHLFAFPVGRRETQMSQHTHQTSKNRHILTVLSIMILGGCLSLIVLFIGLQNGTDFEDKTVWDWLDLFLLPIVVIACFGVMYLWIKRVQEQRTSVEREIALESQRETLMNSYLDLITALFLEDKSDLEGDGNE